MLTRLSQIAPLELMALMNDPLVKRHLPLAPDHMEEADCRALIASKERLWAEHGYGPWAILIDGAFAGWGGLQHESGHADVALVLKPIYWGAGRALLQAFIRRAFGELGLEAVTALLPMTRARVRGMRRMGFIPAGTLQVGGEVFIRYRLDRPDDFSAIAWE